MKTIQSTIFMMLFFCCASAQAATCHALLVGGQAGSPLYERRFQDWLIRSYDLLKKAGVPSEQIQVLTSNPGFDKKIPSGPATAESIVAAVAAISKSAKRDDQFVMIIVGHGSHVEGLGPRLLLPGTDLAVEPLAAAMEDMPCREQIVINLSGIAGEWLGSLAASERVNISACSPEELPDPIFGEFLMKAYEGGRADGYDGGPKDGVVDCLEAFGWATRETVNWIARLHFVAEKNAWRIDGKESVAVFEKLYGGISHVPGARKGDPESDRKVADQEPQIQPKDGQFSAAWNGRRMIDEHAMLEDSGVAEGISGLGVDGFVSFPANELLQPGYLARRTVLGQPTPQEAAP